jgi:hypothetical protein
VPEVYDFLNDESLQNIDVNVEAMEQVTIETETVSATLEMDPEPEVAVATKLLGEDFMTLGHQASVPKSQGIKPGMIYQLLYKMRFITKFPDIPVHSPSFNIAVLSAEQGGSPFHFFPVSSFF